MQGRNRDTDIENRFEYTVEEGKDGTNSENSTNMHALPDVKQIASGKLQYNTWSSSWCSVMI